MAEPTTAAEQASWLEAFPERVTPYNTVPLGQILTYADARRLIADVERLTEERDKRRTAKGEVALLGTETEDAKNKAEAQRDEAVALLRELGECGCYGSAVVLRCEHVEAFLASLSTVTEPCERVYVCCGGKEAPMGTGHYSICASSQLTSIPNDCATHGCAWPESESECPAAVKAES